MAVRVRDCALIVLRDDHELPAARREGQIHLSVEPAERLFVAG